MMIEGIAKKISNYYIFLAITICFILLIIITSEYVFSTFTQIDQSKLYDFSKGLGGVGAFFAFTAVIFFPLRKIGSALRKKYHFLSSQLYKTITKVTAFLHPVLAVFAFFLLTIHGFIFLKIIYNFDFTIILYFGILTLSSLTLLFITGTFLKKKLSRKKLRVIHFIIALIFIISYSLHMLVK